MGNYWLKAVPPRTRGLITYYLLIFLVLGLWSMAIPLMFSLWNLTYLAWASGFVSVAFFALFSVFIYRPYWEFRKAQSRSSQTSTTP
jgi:membrane protein implicated in regulation of membrane protease activity